MSIKMRKDDGMMRALLALLITFTVLAMNVGVVSAQTFLFSIPLGQPALTLAADVAIDSGGNIYVVQWDAAQVVKLGPTGSEIWRIGTPGSGDGQFIYPSGIAVDSSGNIYVADTFNHRIQKFDSSGNFLLKFGTNGYGDGQFAYPLGVAVDSSGNIYVADTWNNRIQKFDSSGTFLLKFGTYGSGDGQFIYPFGVAADGSGNIYVSDPSNNRIQVFGVPSTPADATQNLIDLINSMSLPTNVENPLTAPLNQAVNILNDNNPSNDTAVCEQLTAFINQVDAKEKNGQLSVERATQLKQDAEAIKTSLSCP